MSDSVIYDLSATNETDSRPFINKDWSYVNDQNNGNYSSGQVIISTESLSNSGKWCNYQEAYLRVPLIVVLSGTNGAANNVQDFTGMEGAEFLAGLKSGYWNLIHSLVVEYNNSPAIQSTAYTNVYNCFKANTTYSLDDVKTIGPSLGYCPDSETSWGYSAGPSAMGVGSCNNSNYDVNFVGSLNYGSNSILTGNSGFMERQLNDNVTLPGNGASVLSDVARLGTTLQNRVVKSATSVMMYITATIRLKELGNLFEKFPMVRGATFKFTINMNQSSFTVTKQTRGARALFGPTLARGVDDPSLAIGQMNVTGGTNPLMIASTIGVAVGVGSSGVHLSPDANATPYVLSASVSVGQVTNAMHATISNNARSSLPVRLYAPVYTMNPLRLSEYLNLGQKRIEYTDIFSYQMLNVEGGSRNFNQLISNGMAGIKKVVIIPFLSTATNGGQSTLFSPFASEPSTTSPLPGGALTELNVRIAGMNVLQNNVKYGYEEFLHQVYGINSLNGGVTSGLNSGLISQRMWQNNYQYYVFDCSRRLPEEDRTLKAVEIIGINNMAAGIALDLFIFIEVQREMVVDIATGARVQ